MTHCPVRTRPTENFSSPRPRAAGADPPGDPTGPAGGRRGGWSPQAFCVRAAQPDLATWQRTLPCQATEKAPRMGTCRISGPAGRLGPGWDPSHLPPDIRRGFVTAGVLGGVSPAGPWTPGPMLGPGPSLYSSSDPTCSTVHPAHPAEDQPRGCWDSTRCEGGRGPEGWQ